MKFSSSPKLLPLLLTAVCTLALCGCTSLWQRHRHQSSSVVQFLFPGKDQPFVQPRIPTLRLPLRVGVALVPSTGAQGNYRGLNDTFSEAQKTATHTLMEAVVYDIPSRSLLFRAPGVSTVKNHATLISNESDLHADSSAGYTIAAQDLTTNLQRELDAFKVRAKEEPESVHIEHKPGYRGAGSIEGWFAALLTLLLAARQFVPRPEFFSRSR